MSRAKLRDRLGEHGHAAMVDGRHLELAFTRRFGAEGDCVPGNDHARESHRQAAQALRPARGIARRGGRDAHLQHAVRDKAWKSNRARELVVQVDRVHVAGRLRVGGDLLARESDLAFSHERITNSARERQTGEPCWSLVSVSNETNRRPRRLVSDGTRAGEVTVSPTRGWRRHSNSCSAWSSRAKSTAASSSPNNCGAVTPSE